MPMRLITSTIVCCVAFSSSSPAAPMTNRDCQARLGEIAAGELSADDTLVLNDCALAGLISSADIERAYERAKANRS